MEIGAYDRTPPPNPGPLLWWWLVLLPLNRKLVFRFAPDAAAAADVGE